jgi:hypothetical protein
MKMAKRAAINLVKSKVTPVDLNKPVVEAS